MKPLLLRENKRQTTEKLKRNTGHDALKPFSKDAAKEESSVRNNLMSSVEMGTCPTSALVQNILLCLSFCSDCHIILPLSKHTDVIQVEWIFLENYAAITSFTIECIRTYLLAIWCRNTLISREKTAPGPRRGKKSPDKFL